MNKETKDTVKFNSERSSEWIKKLNELNSRLFLIMGMQKNGSIQIFCDDSMSPQSVAAKLRDYADHLDMGNFIHSNQNN